MNRFLSFVIVVLLLGLNCPSVSIADDTNDIESILIKANEAVIAKDLEMFKSLLVPQSRDFNLTPLEWESTVEDEKKKKVLLQKYPHPKSNCTFITVKKEADRLIYLCESELEDKNTQTIKAISFQKVAGTWKFFGRARIASKAREGGETALKGFSTWQKEGGVVAAIEKDPKFQFEHMFREQTAK